MRAKGRRVEVQVFESVVRLATIIEMKKEMETSIASCPLFGE